MNKDKTNAGKENEGMDDDKGMGEGWITKRVWSGDRITKYISNDEI